MKIDIEIKISTFLNLDILEELWDEFLSLYQGKKCEFYFGNDYVIEFNLSWDYGTTVLCTNFHLVANNENLQLLFKAVSKEDFLSSNKEYNEFQKRIDKLTNELGRISTINKIPYGALVDSLRKKCYEILC